MADIKKYYYMRLKENFFETEEMLLLESQQDGYLYSNILIKLYLKSLKHDGRLIFKDTIPYNADMIATITRQPVGVVEKALQLFLQLDLISVIDGQVLYMNDIELLVGKTSTEGDRKKAARAKIQSGQMKGIGYKEESGQTSDKRPPEIRVKSIENKEYINTLSVDKSTNEKEILELLKNLENLPTPRALTSKRKTQLNARIDEYGLEEYKKLLIEFNNSELAINATKEKKAKTGGGWLDLDWLVNPNNVIKIAEGKYNNKHSFTSSDNKGYNPYAALESQFNKYKEEATYENDNRNDTKLIQQNVNTFF